MIYTGEVGVVTGPGLVSSVPFVPFFAPTKFEWSLLEPCPPGPRPSSPPAVTRGARRDSHNLLQTTRSSFQGATHLNFGLRAEWMTQMILKSFLIILNLSKIIVKLVPMIFYLWTDTVTNRRGQLTRGDRGRGIGGRAGLGPGPLLGETTDCLYRSHKFPTDNIVTLSTYTIFHPRRLLDFQDCIYLKYAYLCKEMSTQNSVRDGQ